MGLYLYSVTMDWNSRVSIHHMLQYPHLAPEWPSPWAGVTGSRLDNNAPLQPLATCNRPTRPLTALNNGRQLSPTLDNSRQPSTPNNPRQQMICLAQRSWGEQPSQQATAKDGTGFGSRAQGGYLQ